MGDLIDAITQAYALACKSNNNACRKIRRLLGEYITPTERDEIRALAREVVAENKYWKGEK